MVAGLIRAHDFLHLIEKELFEDVRLERGAGFACHYHQGISQVDLIANGPHLLRIGGIDDAQLRETRLLSKGETQHLGAEAGAAHAEQQNRLEIGGFYLRAQRGKSRQVLPLPLDDVDPAQPFLLAVASPQAGILLPEAGNFVVDGPVGGGLVYGSAKFIGKCESEAHLVLDCASKKGFRKLSTVT